MGEGEMYLRVGAAVLLGGAMGLERELGGHEAGLRTYLMVALGACIFTMSSVAGVGAHPSSDVTRIASQVVVGVGFLGGGTIIRERGSVKGLTTAAGLWVSAAVGMAAAFGELRLAVVATLLSLAVMTGLARAERWLRARLDRARR